jgi:predicted O-methyltransferase YrrM
MELINPLAEAYCSAHSSSLDAVINELAQSTNDSHAHAHMLSGPQQGKFLEMICRMINPKKVLEIGTFTGYSALSMIKGMYEDGILHTIELREQDAQTALEYFKKANKELQIKLHIGNALEIIPNLDENWDLVFIDADKVSYIDYYELTLPKLKQGGWMIVDNVLFHGQVLEENITGKNAKAIDALINTFRLTQEWNN